MYESLSGIENRLDFVFIINYILREICLKFLHVIFYFQEQSFFTQMKGVSTEDTANETGKEMFAFFPWLFCLF